MIPWETMWEARKWCSIVAVGDCCIVLLGDTNIYKGYWRYLHAINMFTCIRRIA